MTPRALVLVALLVVHGSCLKKNPIYCDVASDCESGACVVEIHTCVDSIDAAVPDAPADASVDADTTPDADTTVAIVQTYQQADLVLGQSTFDSETAGGCTASSVSALSIASDNGVLYIGDRLAQRVLVWSPIPTGSNAAANRVIGQPNLTTCGRRTISQNDVWDYPYVSAGGGKVAVTDWFRSRVLIWNPAPVSNDEAADRVLGQPDFVSMAEGMGANQFSFPEEIWTDGTRLAVVDRSNSRVLLWTTFPTTNAEPADIVLGQPGFGLGAVPASPSQSNLYYPGAVWSDGTRMIVADSGHHRVLIWSTFPSTNGQAADLVLGQPNFTTSASGLSPSAMNAPRGVAANADALFVSDLANDRVLVFSPFPTSNGEVANYVLGQPDLTTGANNPAPTQQSLDQPRKLVIVGSDLWVADGGHERVLRFSLYPP